MAFRFGTQLIVWTSAGFALCAAAMAQPAPSEQTTAPPIAGSPPSKDGSAVEAELRLRYSRLSETVATGKLDEAEAGAREILSLAQRHFGPTDGNVGAAARTLGRIIRQRGRPREAAPYLLKALEIASGFFPLGHDTYKAAVGELAEAFVAAGAGEDAVRLYMRILEGATKAPGLELETAHYRTALGLAQRQMGRHADAEANIRQALALREQHLPAGHAQIGDSLNHLGGLMRVTGRLAEAEHLFQRALAIMRTLPAGDVGIAITLDNLGTVQGEQGRLSDAERSQREAVALFESRLGPDHVTTAQGLANLAALFQQQKRHGEALVLFERAVAIYRRKLPPADSRLAVALDNLGALRMDLGQPAAALKLREEALRNLLAAHGEAHPSVAIALNNLAASQDAAGNFAQAEETYDRALKVGAAVFGERSPWSGVTYANIGDLHRSRQRLDRAGDAYRRAIAITETTLGPQHATLVLPLLALAEITQGGGDHAAALALARRALQIEIDHRNRRRLDPEDRGADDGHARAVLRAVAVLWQASAALPSDLDLPRFSGEPFAPAVSCS